MRLVGIWQAGSNGDQSFTGTDTTKIVGEPIGVCDIPQHYFFGQIINTSNIDCIVQVRSWFGFKHVHSLLANSSLKIKGVPIKDIAVAVNGTVIISAVGLIIEPNSQQEEVAVLSKAEITEETTRITYYPFTIYDDVVIAAITTTTVSTPAAGNSMRIKQITIESAAAQVVTLKWTDAGGANPKIIAVINLGGGGSYTLDEFDIGIVNPDGINGLLRATTSTANSTEIDVIRAESPTP